MNGLLPLLMRMAVIAFVGIAVGAALSAVTDSAVLTVIGIVAVVGLGVWINRAQWVAIYRRPVATHE